MRRGLVALAASTALIACGLTVEGLAGSLTENDGGVVEAGSGPPPLGDAAPDAASDAAPETHDCHVRSCAAAGDAGPCFAESCAADGGHWQKPELSGGGAMTQDGGLCHTTTPDAGPKAFGTVFQMLSGLPMHYRYDVYLDVQSDLVSNAATILISFDDASGSYAFTIPTTAGYEICQGIGEAPPDCGAPIALPTTPSSAYVHLYGEVDRTDAGVGDIVVETADSPTSCVEAHREALAGPFADHLEVFVGCAGASCDRTWTDAVASVTPEP